MIVLFWELLIPYGIIHSMNILLSHHETAIFYAMLYIATSSFCLHGLSSWVFLVGAEAPPPPNFRLDNIYYYTLCSHFVELALMP